MPRGIVLSKSTSTIGSKKAPERVLERERLAALERERLAAIAELMRLEARRNFLRSHAARAAAYLVPANGFEGAPRHPDLDALLAPSPPPVFDHCEAVKSEVGGDGAESEEQCSAKAAFARRGELLTLQIKALESYLQCAMVFSSDRGTELNGLKLILLPYEGKDEAGISTNIAAHYEGILGVKPFVELTAEGLYLYIPAERRKAIEEFCGELRSLGFELQVAQASPGGEGVPKEYTSGCRRLHIPHLQVEKFLRNSQYNPYSIKPVTTAWYEARGLDRGMLVLQEAARSHKATPKEKMPVFPVEMSRMPFSATEDLIELVVSADVKTLAKAESVASRQHVVVLLDNSGSMLGGGGSAEGGAIRVAMKALKKLILGDGTAENPGLSDDTLVSIQPMRGTTRAYRVSAGDIKRLSPDSEKYGEIFSEMVGGDTPLLEIIASSAVFLRPTPEDLLLSETALNNTVVIALTDGQPNGSAKDAVLAMQTSTCKRNVSLCLPALAIPGFTPQNFISYGVDGFMCRHLPMIFPVGIGAGVDEKFLEELASSLHGPLAFVGADANMESDISRVLQLAAKIKERIPVAFIGVSYVDTARGDGAETAQGIEVHNVLEGRTRRLFFRVPKTATKLSLGIIVDKWHLVEQPVVLQTARDNLALVQDYIEYHFKEWVIQFRHDAAALDTDYAALVITKGARDSEKKAEAIAVEPEKEAGTRKLEALKKAVLEEIQVLRDACTESRLLGEIGNFIQLMEGIKAEGIKKFSELPIKDIACLGRDKIAEQLQTRVVGNPAPSVRPFGYSYKISF